VTDPPATTTTTTTTTATLPVVQQQPKAPAVVAPTEVSVTKLATLPSTHRCVSRRRFRIRLLHAAGLASADIALNGSAKKHVKGKALGLPIDLRGLPKGTVTVTVTVTKTSGQRLAGKRKYHTCVPKHRS
jgi:hypothetical protein